MFRDSSKALLAGLMWAIITVRLFPPRESWMAGRVGCAQGGTPSPGPCSYQAVLAHSVTHTHGRTHSHVLVLSIAWTLPGPDSPPPLFPLPTTGFFSKFPFEISSI